MKNSIALTIFLSLAFNCSLIASMNQLPDGPYKSECTQCRMQGNMLDCYCPLKRNGEVHYNYTTIMDLFTCHAPIRNINGTLQCLPAGSYEQSCTGCTVDSHKVLKCQCKDAKGDWAVRCSSTGCKSYISELNLTNCGTNDIYNDNGTLKCESKK